MFQFSGFPPYTYLIQYTVHSSPLCGFPHSDIPGSRLIYSSPRLFAVNRVLRRLLMPRHSSYALLSLNNPCSPCLSFDNFFRFVKTFSLKKLLCFSTCLVKLQLNLNFSERPFLSAPSSISIRLTPALYSRLRFLPALCRTGRKVLSYSIICSFLLFGFQ